MKENGYLAILILIKFVSIYSGPHFFFKEQYQNRKVNSIYFDDLNYSSIKQNLDGVSDKKKYRIRWYGDYIY